MCDDISGIPFLQAVILTCGGLHFTAGVAAWKSDRDEQSSQGWQVPVKDFTDFTDPASIDLNGASRPRFMVPDMNGTHGLARAPGMKLEAGVKPEEAGIQLGCAVGKLEEGGDGAEASHRERSSPAVASTSSDGAGTFL